MTIASDLSTRTIFKVQSALGTKSTASSAQILRRVSNSIGMGRSAFESAEIRDSQQVFDSRLGVKAVSGSITGELSPGTYQVPMAAVLRAAFASQVVGGPESDITVTASGDEITLTSAATATFVTDGLTAGMVVRITGLAESGNNANNVHITSVTETVMVGNFVNQTTAVAESSGSAFTITEVGKHVTTPTSGHLRQYFTIEKDYIDISQQEQFVDTVFDGFKLGLTPDGMATIDLPVMGLSQDTSTTAYFTSPTAATSTGIVAAPNGVMTIDGVGQTTVTGISDLSVSGQSSAIGGVVGSSADPDILPGVLKVTGTMSVLFENATVRDQFLNETEVAVSVVLTTDNTATADFVAFNMPRVKFTGADKSTSGNALLLTLPFQALENTSGTGEALGTIIYQDSQAA